VENSVEVSIKDAPAAVKESMETALLESGEEINRLRGVVREATQRIAADRQERTGAASDLVPGEFIASGPVLDRKGVIASIIELLAHPMLDHSIRHQDGMDKWAGLAFDFAEKLYAEGVARGVYEADPESKAAAE